MLIEIGDMWSVYDKTDLFIFTANSFITREHKLVMGAGLALEVNSRVPYVARYLGGKILEIGHQPKYLGKAFLPFQRFYGLAIWKRKPEQSVAAFQVKYHFKDYADTELIERSAMILKELAEKYPNARFDMNFPGIGCGHLPESRVRPIISSLPDNVHVWRRN